MASVKIQEYLDQSPVHYVSIMHPPVFTAQELAEVSHVSGHQYAKVVIIKVKEALTMLVLPACQRLDLIYLVSFRQARVTDLF